ncbi:MAG: hypothetical protein AB7F35_20765 [Acetobacteraceae bacterium]
MISRIRQADRQQLKLLWSLGASLLTRIPGAVGILWFLPLLLQGLGTDYYADLLSAMALGAGSAFLIGGISLVGRRAIGAAYANGDTQSEADSFITLIVVNTCALAVALSIIAGYTWMRGADAAVFVAAALPACAIFGNSFDNARSAYNEHYVTAASQFVFQTSLYTIGLLMPATRESLILAAVIIQGHFVLASLVTLVLLVRKRPYLLKGRPVNAWRMGRQGALVSTADGILMTTLSLAVVWLQASGNTAASAWFATSVRLFQMFLLPIVLLMIPISSYVRLCWNKQTVAKQRAFSKLLLAAALGYGIMASIGLLIGSELYIGGVLGLPDPDRWSLVLPIFLLFGAIVGYQSYASVAYLVLDDPAHLSSWITTGAAFAVAVAAITNLRIDALATINVYAAIAGSSILIALLWSVVRFDRSSRAFEGVGVQEPSSS